MIKLKVISGDSKGARIESSGERITLGRAADQTIAIDDPFVSRNHGEIVLLPSGYKYRDLDSLQGTQLRREGSVRRVTQVFLQAGDELYIGGAGNVVRVEDIDISTVQEMDSSISRRHVQAETTLAPEVRYASDSPSLKALVAFDSVIMHAEMTSDAGLCRALVEHVSGLFDNLAYVAVLDCDESRPALFESEVLDEGARVRLSSTLLTMVDEIGRGIVFEIDSSGALQSQGTVKELSEDSLLGISTSGATLFSGMCVPIGSFYGLRKYLQLERPKKRGEFTLENLELVASMALRVAGKLENFQLIRENHRLHHTATLGVFASMIGHDIKNYLFYGKKLSEIIDDPLAAHPGITKGIERARSLAQSMKDLATQGTQDVSSFSVGEIVQSITDEFGSLFGERCLFEARLDEALPKITSNPDLVSRVLWNLVMNAYHSMDNRSIDIVGEPRVRVHADRAGDCVRLVVKDNAGGIGPRTLEYIKRSFKLIADTYLKREDLIGVVNEIGNMAGFTNSIGLFFTAVAVNDLHGKIRVESKQDKGSRFIIELPVVIDSTRNLLLY